jgi:hypothetical protein
MAELPPDNTPQVPPDRADLHKHLDFVQAIIGRLANNSFLMKGWALTVAAALFGYSVTNLSWPVALLGFMPPLSFWYLDSYYLRQERMFRCLYKDVAAGRAHIFSLDVRPYADRVARWDTVTSETLRWFYGIILVVAAVLLVAVIAATSYKQPEVRQAPHPGHHHSTTR